MKIGARPLWGRGRVCFGDLKYQYWLPEITYPTFKTGFMVKGHTYILGVARYMYSHEKPGCMRPYEEYRKFTLNPEGGAHSNACNAV